MPWAITRVFHARLAAGATEEQAQALVDSFPGMQFPDAGLWREPTPFGWLWHREEGESVAAPAGHTYWQRTLVFLSPEDRATQAKEKFLNPTPPTQGLCRMELYLHKGLHHAREYEGIDGASGAESMAGDLEANRRKLASSAARVVGAPGGRPPQGRQQDAYEVAREQMDLLAIKGQVDLRLSGLKNNVQALSENLVRVRLAEATAPVYYFHVRRLARTVVQIESDLERVQATLESAGPILDIQRGVEAMGLEKSSFLLSVTAALLAGVAIFNSFLDIWSLAVEGANLTLPHPLLRLGLGLLAGVSWPLGFYWAVGREKKWPAGIALFFAVLSLGLAVLFTWLASRAGS
jgi:hypothetical protein